MQVDLGTSSIYVLLAFDVTYISHLHGGNLTNNFNNYSVTQQEMQLEYAADDVQRYKLKFNSV